MRPRLLRRFTELPPGVVLVVGHTGSGKSTLLAHLAGQAIDDGVGVVRARCLDHGLLQWQGFDPREQASDQHADERVLPLPVAVDAIAAGTRIDLVVVDDGDRMRSHPDHEREFERLVRLLPEHVRVVVAVAVLPPHILARYDRAPAGTITATDLAFRPYEVDQLFRDVHRAPLRADDVHTLTRATDGWPAALELFRAAHARDLPGDVSRAVRALVDDPWYLAGYADDVLLADCTPADRALLRWGSVFEDLTPSRLEALLGTGDHDGSLRRIQALPGLPVSSTAAGLRLPGPLRRYLRAIHSRDLGRHGAREWFASAAAILEADGDVAAAIACYGHAGNHGAARPLAERRSARLWNGARAVEPWDAPLTRALRAEGVPLDPELAGADAVFPRARAFAELSRAMANGSLVVADALLERLESLDGHDPRLERLRGSLTAWHSAGTVSVEPGRDVEWRTLLRWVLQGAPVRPDPHRPGELIAAGVVHGLTQELDRARSELRRVIQDPAVGTGLTLLATLADLLLDRDLPVARAIDGADRVLTEAHARGLLWTERVAHAVVLALEGEPGWRDGLGRLRSWGYEVSDAWGPLVLSSVAEVCAARRDEDDSQRWLELAAAWQERGLPLVAEVCRLAATRRNGEHLEDGAGLDDWPADQGATQDAPGARTAAAERTDATPRARTPEVHVRCLGELEVLVGGHAVDLSHLRPRARSLLRMLALEAGRVVHRERLVEALWYDLPAASAMHNLHVGVSAVRRALNEAEPGLGRRLLQREGDSYVLRIGPGASCDVLDLEAALRSGQYAASRDDDDRARSAWARALAAYTDDLLPEEGSAEWVVGPRERLRQQVAAAATSLAVLLLRSDEAAAAAVAAARAIELDEWRDPAWRALIEALTRTGQTASAQRARRSYRAMLHSLGVEEQTGVPARGLRAVTPGRTMDEVVG